MLETREDLETAIDAKRRERGKAAFDGRPFEKITNDILALESRLSAIGDLEHERQVRADEIAARQAAMERQAFQAERTKVKEEIANQAATAEAATKALVAALTALELSGARLRKITVLLKEEVPADWQQSELRNKVGYSFAEVFKSLCGSTGRYGGITMARRHDATADFWCSAFTKTVTKQMKRKS